jgi:hypothetical protein
MPKISIKQLIFTGFSPLPKTHSKFKQLNLAQYCKLVLSECNDLYFVAIAFIAPKTASVQVFWGHSVNKYMLFEKIFSFVLKKYFPEVSEAARGRGTLLRPRENIF